ncbi:MAG: response regulator [Alphaproteobacteria bacterium]|nr:response regulator [Alphaproteobacteria bacterium]
MTPDIVAGLGGLRIMVIDDDSVMRGILRRMLHQGGIQDVETVAGGEQALPQLEGAQRVPDVILCDLYMKGMDGLYFCNKARRSDRDSIRTVPIMILTAEHTEMVHEVGRQIGVSQVLTKPISTNELLAAIGRVLGFVLAAPNIEASAFRQGKAV